MEYTGLPEKYLLVNDWAQGKHRKFLLNQNGMLSDWTLSTQMLVSVVSIAAVVMMVSISSLPLLKHRFVICHEKNDLL